MIGIIIELIISWLLLKFIEKENLNALGLQPSMQRIKDFLTGLLLPVLFFLLLLFTLAWVGENPYLVNPNYNAGKFLSAVFYLFKSVAFENLIFTGALLFILIKRLGAKKAIFISAAAFGIYHWFSWNLFGQPVQMAIVFLMTGVAGYLWALAFQKTKSMYLPFALHFGTDFVLMIIFSQDKNLGIQLLTKTFEKDPASPGPFISLLLTLFYFTGLPLLTYLYLRKKKTGSR